MVQRKRLGNSVSALLILALCAASWAADKSAGAKADRVVIVKSTRTLTLLNHGQVLKTYQVALGGDPVGPRVKAGDKRTPEGEYGSARTQAQTLPSILSLIGLTLATASGLLALSSVLYAHAIGGFPYYDPRLLRIYRWGGMLSLSGIVFGIGGVWRPGPVRWLAPVCSLGTLLFWFASAMGE